MLVLAPLAAPIACSGSTSASVSMTMSMTRWEDLALSATAAGATQLATVPGGAMIAIASMAAWLFGSSGSSSAFSEAPSLARQVVEIGAPRIRNGGLVLNDNGEADYPAYVPIHQRLSLYHPAVQGRTTLQSRIDW
jgi:hypothetical protein